MALFLLHFLHIWKVRVWHVAQYLSVSMAGKDNWLFKCIFLKTYCMNGSESQSQQGSIGGYTAHIP